MRTTNRSGSPYTDPLFVLLICIILLTTIGKGVHRERTHLNDCTRRCAPYKPVVTYLPASCFCDESARQPERR